MSIVQTKVHAQALINKMIKSDQSLFFRLYQGLSLWLEESRLHDPNLYIDALPDAYIPELLVKVFQGNEVYYLLIFFDYC